MKWFSDDWSFLDSSRAPSTRLKASLFDSYNQHWSTVSVALYRAILALFGMAHYLPYAVPLIAAHLAVVAISRSLMLRSGLPNHLATLVTFPVLFLSSAYTDLLWGFPVNLVGAVAIGLLAVLLLHRRSDSYGWCLLAGGVCLISAATSNAGIAMTVGATLFVLTKQGWRLALVTAAPAAAGYVSWWLFFGSEDSGACSSNDVSGENPVAFFVKAVEKGLSGIIGQITGTSVVVAAVIGVGIAPAFTQRRLAQSRYTWPVCGLATSFLLYALAAAGRAGCGEDASRAPRYAYFAVLTLPALALGLKTLVRRLPGLTAPACAVLVLAGTVNASRLLSDAHCRQVRVDAAWKQLSYINTTPSTLNPQVTPAEVADLTAHFGLRLPARSGAANETTSIGC